MDYFINTEKSQRKNKGNWSLQTVIILPGDLHNKEVLNAVFSFGYEEAYRFRVWSLASNAFEGDWFMSMLTLPTV